MLADGLSQAIISQYLMCAKRTNRGGEANPPHTPEITEDAE
jgi:hypothetical protein